jgi:hypothetical protein
MYSLSGAEFYNCVALCWLVRAWTFPFARQSGEEPTWMVVAKVAPSEYPLACVSDVVIGFLNHSVASVQNPQKKQQ